MLAALAQDPTDLNAHLNVLEFYYMRRNADKFEAAAEAMYAQLPDPNAPEWQGALLMGRDLCPTHPMFSDGDDHAAATSAFADPFASVPKFEGHEPKAQAPVQDDDFDFDLVFGDDTTEAYVLVQQFRQRQQHEQRYRIMLHDALVDAAPSGYDKRSPNPKRPRFRPGPFFFCPCRRRLRAAGAGGDRRGERA